MKDRKILAMVIALMVFSGSYRAQTETVTLGGGAKLVAKTFKEENKERVFEISAEYPELQGFEPAATAAKFNQLVKTRVMQDVDEFRRSMLEMDAEELKFAREFGSPYYTEIGYTVALANRDVISLSFGNGTFTGGAHPNSYSFTINYDLKNAAEMKLSDLFRPGSNYLRLISDYAVADLKKQLESDSDDEWITRGAGPDEENFKSWTISADGLKIEFDAYQVAAYVYGPQEVVIPFDKLRSVLRVLDFEPLRFANNGNPVNWCRNGLFAQDDADFRIARVVGGRTEKVFFYEDDRDDCPQNEKCKTRSYVIPGDEVIVAGTYGKFGCSWYQPKKGAETVGWIALDKLSMVASEPNITVADWLGQWDFFDNSINVAKGTKPGSLKITGTAIWQGLGDNVHVGELDDSAVPNGDRMSFGGSDEYDCRVRMQRVGRFLIVADNLNCGGLNVTFSGVYQRK